MLHVSERSYVGLSRPGLNRVLRVSISNTWNMNFRWSQMLNQHCQHYQHYQHHHHVHFVLVRNRENTFYYFNTSLCLMRCLCGGLRATPTRPHGDRTQLAVNSGGISDVEQSDQNDFCLTSLQLGHIDPSQASCLSMFAVTIYHLVT
jgi:hypothetical protein